MPDVLGYKKQASKEACFLYEDDDLILRLPIKGNIAAGIHQMCTTFFG